jgi:hypothetical protein
MNFSNTEPTPLPWHHTIMPSISSSLGESKTYQKMNNKKKQEKNKRLKTSYPQFLSWLLAAAAAGPKKNNFFFLLKRSLPPRPAGSTPDCTGPAGPCSCEPRERGPSIQCKIFIFFCFCFKIEIFIFITPNPNQ